MTVDSQILTALRQAGESGVAGTDLSSKLNISRAAIWSRIEELRQLGYDIEASPHLGYRLLSSPDVLHADDLLAALGKTQVVGRDIRVFQETTSTNDVVEKLSRDNVREGVVVFAESQTKGRGRLGRKWMSSSRKGLWFSILLRPSLRPHEATQITIAAATALQRAIALATGLKPEIKWPNDIMLRGKKVVGILTELSAEVDRVKHLILGIGINVNHSESDFSEELKPIATSLKVEAGHKLNRAEIAVHVLRELDRDYARLRNGAFAQVADDWEANCSTLGKQVAVNTAGRIIEGRAEALDRDGALLLRTQFGQVERIVGGDVSLRK